MTNHHQEENQIFTPSSQHLTFTFILNQYHTWSSNQVITSTEKLQNRPVKSSNHSVQKNLTLWRVEEGSVHPNFQHYLKFIYPLLQEDQNLDNFLVSQSDESTTNKYFT